MVDPPRFARGTRHRAAECQAALDAMYLNIVAVAVAAGWGPDEVARAVISLARSYEAVRCATVVEILAPSSRRN